MTSNSPFKLLSPNSVRQTAHPYQKKPQNTRSVDELATLIERGERPDFLFFWGHMPKNRDILDQSCFSTWFPAAFTLHGITYLTAEHYLMAEKARLFGDMPTRLQILAASSPSAAKNLGRKVAGSNDAIWCMHRFDIIVAANEAKFSQNTELAGLLQQTGSKILVEASPLDDIGGIGLAKEHENAGKPGLWRGLNLLGFALMEVRARLNARHVLRADHATSETPLRPAAAFGYAEAGESRMF